MDVKKFQDSRKAELDAFKKQYQFLKGEHASTLSSAINETDPVQQQILLQRVQQINSQLVSELHEIVLVLSKGANGFNAKELDDLTADLIKYQKEYAEIEKTKDRVETLKRILQSNNEKLNNATYTYYVYIAILVLLSFYVVYLVLTTSWSQNIKRSFRATIAPS